MLICKDGCGTHNPDTASVCQGCQRNLRSALRLYNPGDRVRHYRVGQIIGWGGFGAVYKAEDTRTPGSRFALKESLDPSGMTSFQGEFAVLQQHPHPHLPTYEAMFVEQGSGYLVMEFIPGQSLEEVSAAAGGPLEETQVLGFALQLCEVLAYLHRQNPPILHRDLKPANVRLTPSGLIKLVDFGLFKQGTNMTVASRMGLSPAYAPVEQHPLNPGHTDQRSDIYSLGATLYQLLTGQMSITSFDRIGQPTDPLVPLGRLNPRLSPHVAATVMKAMNLNPEERYPNITAFKQALLGQQLHRSIRIGSPLISFSSKVAGASSTPKPPTIVELLAEVASRWRKGLQALTRNRPSTPLSHSPETVSQPSPVVSGSPPTIHLMEPKPSLNPSGVLPRHPEIVQPGEDHTFEDLILHRDYERIWRTFAYANGGRYVLTGYGPFGATSLIRCAVEKARSVLQASGYEHGALVALHFRVTREQEDDFDLEADKLTLGHPNLPDLASNPNWNALKAFATRHGQTSPMTPLGISLAEPLGVTFFNLSGATMVKPATQSEAYDFPQFVAELNTFFKGRQDEQALYQLISRFIGSKILPSRLVVIIDKVQHLATLERLSASLLLRNPRTMSMIIVRKEHFDSWDKRSFPSTGFSKWYVPCLWKIAPSQLLVTDSVDQQPERDLFLRHLEYKGRGSFGHFFTELNHAQNIHYDPSHTVLATSDAVKRPEVRHNAWMQALLDLHWQTLLGNDFGGKEQAEDEDRAKIGIYYLLDWISTTKRFTKERLLEVSGEQTIAVATDTQLVVEILRRLLSLLVSSKYLKIEDSTYCVIWNSAQPPPLQQVKVPKSRVQHPPVSPQPESSLESAPIPTLSVIVPPRNKPKPSKEPIEHLDIQLLQDGNDATRFTVQVIDSSGSGEPRASSKVPYNRDQLLAVLKALQAPPSQKQTEQFFKPEQIENLQALGLMKDNSLLDPQQRRQKVGEALYHSIFTGDVHVALQIARQKARSNNKGTVGIRLRFNDDAVELARLPWELFHDSKSHLIATGEIEITRYITFAAVPTPLQVDSPLQLLYVAPRPATLDLPLLPNEEQQRIRKVLQILEHEGEIRVSILEPPTYEALLDYINQYDVHILHFDGHGCFARPCRHCWEQYQQRHYPNTPKCDRCGADLSRVMPEGFLAFEQEDKKADWISSTDLGTDLCRAKHLRLAILSACSSATVRGVSLFSGVAPKLIQVGIPAVVATQLPISTQAAAKFSQNFYGALVKHLSIPAAVNAGRRHLTRDTEWFIPVLYLRSNGIGYTDEEGSLFTSLR